MNQTIHETIAVSMMCGLFLVAIGALLFRPSEFISWTAPGGRLHWISKRHIVRVTEDSPDGKCNVTVVTSDGASFSKNFRTERARRRFIKKLN